MKKLILPLGLFAMLFWSLASCDKGESFTTDSSAKLEFSLDTLRFDTVFTELGSATRSFKVYNRNDQAIRISKARIEGTEGAFFRMNVDGIPGNEVEQVEVYANDSIYVFVEVTIDPDQPESISPFVIEDKIIFETNGNTQEVRLEAWGQNANYLPSRFNKGVPVVYTCDNDEWVWDDAKPYVIYGEVLIDSCLLRIAAGTKIYVHGGVAQNDLFGIFSDGILFFLPQGQLKIEGTAEDPVVIQGDRLEESFQDVAGQWYGIILSKGSKGNEIDHAVIKNAAFGIYVDSTAELTVRNSQFYNTTGGGIVGFHSTIDATNCLLYNNNSTSLQLILGGSYNFTHCTFASYGVDASAASLGNSFCYKGTLTSCELQAINPMKARFQNCIFFGSRRDEIDFSDISGRQDPSLFDVKMDHCLVKVDELLTDNESLYGDFFETFCTNCVNGTRTDELFIDADEDDYHLDTMSIAIDIGMQLAEPTIDLEGNARDANPDAGCFEFQQ